MVATTMMMVAMEKLIAICHVYVNVCDCNCNRCKSALSNYDVIKLSFIYCNKFTFVFSLNVCVCVCVKGKIFFLLLHDHCKKKYIFSFLFFFLLNVYVCIRMYVIYLFASLCMYKNAFVCHHYWLLLGHNLPVASYTRPCCFFSSSSSSSSPSSFSFSSITFYIIHR